MTGLMQTATHLCSCQGGLLQQQLPSPALAATAVSPACLREMSSSAEVTADALRAPEMADTIYLMHCSP